MPKVQYLGPYNRREVDRSDLNPQAEPTPEGEEAPEPERLVWVQGDNFVELSDEEFAKLQQITNKSDWAIQAESDERADESASQPESAPSDSGSDQASGMPS